MPPLDKLSQCTDVCQPLWLVCDSVGIAQRMSCAEESGEETEEGSPEGGGAGGGKGSGGKGRWRGGRVWTSRYSGSKPHLGSNTNQLESSLVSSDLGHSRHA